MARKKVEEVSAKEEFGNEEATEDAEESEESEESEGSSQSDMPQREMHKIKCSDCGNDAEVPFAPTEGRPVYCRDCFMKHRKPRRSFSGGGGYNRRY